MSFKMMNFLKNKKEGIGTVEIVIIIAILIGLALIFKNQIYDFVNDVFFKIFQSAGSVTDLPAADATYDLGSN